MWVRFMVFKDGMWVDFEENAMDVMVSDFVSGEAIIEMEMEGCNLIFLVLWNHRYQFGKWERSFPSLGLMLIVRIFTLRSSLRIQISLIKMR